MTGFRTLLIAAVALSSTLSGLAREYIVDGARGCDTNSGTADAPLLTLAGALPKLAPGDVCVIRGGVYREVLKPPVSGRPGAPISFRAFPGEKVVISAGERVVGWRPDADGVYKATVPLAPVGGLVFAHGRKLIEARWPNADGDFLVSPKGSAEEDANSGSVDKKAKDSIIDRKLPAFPPSALEGAKIWYSQWYNGWFPSLGKVKAYDPERKMITLEGKIVYSDSGRRWPPDWKFSYVVYGTRELLDADNEWAYEADSKQLYVRLPGKMDPSKAEVEKGVRADGVDLRGRSFIEIEGIELLGGKIATDQKTTDCSLRKIKMYYAEGSTLNGDRNEIRDSELAYSDGPIIRIGGNRLRFVNNHLYNIAQTAGYGMWMGGRENLIAYNTIERSAGHLMLLSTMDGCQVVHNFFRDASLLSRDSGSIYCLSNGGNSEIAYNQFMTDYRRLRYVNAVYIDGRGSHLLIHHNVLPVLALGGPKPNTLVYNNTFYRYSDYSEEKSDKPVDRVPVPFDFKADYPGTQFCNNLVVFDDQPLPGMPVAGTLARIDPGGTFKDSSGRRLDRLEEPWTYDFTLRPGSPAIDAGIPIPGIADGFTGKAPDTGAYEFGVPAWTAGHDFKNPSGIQYKRPECEYVNLLANPGFELSNTLEGWVKTGTKTAKFQSGAFAWRTDNLNVASHYGGAKLGAGANGLEQEAAGLHSGATYLVWGWVKPTDEKQQVRLGVRLPDGKELDRTLTRRKGWVRLLLTFEVPKGVDRVTFFAEKTSADDGDLFFDEASLTKLMPMEKVDPSSGATRFIAVEDTYVNRGAPDQVLGYETEAAIKSAGNNTDRKTLLKFDLSSLKGKKIEKATLRLYSTGAFSSGFPSLGIYAVEDSQWVSRGAGAVTWNTQPAMGELLSRIDSKDLKKGWITVDITNYVQTRLGGDGVVSLALWDPDKLGKYLFFATTQQMACPPVQTSPPSIEVVSKTNQ